MTGFCGADHFRASFPDGRVGSDQHQASVALGERLLAAAVADLLRKHEAWLAQR